jgi:hypothetical protein
MTGVQVVGQARRQASRHTGTGAGKKEARAVSEARQETHILQLKMTGPSSSPHGQNICHRMTSQRKELTRRPLS